MTTASLVDAFIDAGRAVERALEVRLHPLGIGVMQLRILELCAVRPMKPTELAPALVQEVHSVSSMLGRLEDRGLVERTDDKSDRRVRWVSATDEGKRIADAACAMRVEVEATLRVGDALRQFEPSLYLNLRECQASVSARPKGAQA